VSIQQRTESATTSANGGEHPPLAEGLGDLAREYGNRFLLEPAPDNALPEHGMRSVDAMRLIGGELVLDGIPNRNLATFVTTWMEPEAQRIIAENLHRNFIDHAEYPQTAEIEQRCIRMLADLFNAPGETTGARTQGSSEAIMLGALSLKWKWRQRREAAGKDTTRPNLVFGGDVHVVWEKFCRYFDVEPRIIPLQRDKYTIGPDDVEPHIDENTIGVAAVLGTTFTGHADDIPGINDMLVRLRDEKGLDVPLHVDGASGGFVWPFLYPDSKWDFRLEQVRSINVSGHKFGLVYPGIGWLIFRERSDLAEDLVFYENYLGKTDATFTLNFSTGSSMVLAQYYNFVRLGRAGYRYVMETMMENTRLLAQQIAEMGPFRLIGEPGAEQLPLVAFQLAEEHDYDEFDIAVQLSAERGWVVPAYTLPPNAEHVTIMRALVKQTLGRALALTLASDLAEACETLEKTGGLHELDRRRVKTGTGY
jgi:glutamate decarboxylase